MNVDNVDDPDLMDAAGLDEQRRHTATELQEAEKYIVPSVFGESYMEAESPELNPEPPDMPWAGKRIITPEINPVEALLQKLERWLIQQPEWAIILAAPRKTRRQAVSLLAKRILTIPNRYGSFGK